MSVQKYEVFIKVVELGNITKAAAELGYSQSAMSHVVSSLEKELRVTLLIRDRNGVRLTREGEELIPYLRRVVEENRILMEKITELTSVYRGTIHVGAFASAMIHLLPGLISSFTAEHPQIDFHMRQGGYLEIAQLISDGRLDCGFVQTPTNVPLDTIPVFQDELFAVFPPGTRPEQKTFPIEDIDKEPFIMVKELEHGVQGLLKKYHVQIAKKLYSDYDYGILPMVANGLGMCIFPGLMLRNLPYELEIKALEPPAFRSIALGYRKDLLSPMTKQFIAHVQSSLQKQA